MDDQRRLVTWITEKLPREHYDQVPVSWIDLAWDNVAEPQHHWFRIPQSGEPLQLYRRNLPPAPAP